MDYETFDRLSKARAINWSRGPNGEECTCGYPRYRNGHGHATETKSPCPAGVAWEKFQKEYQEWYAKKKKGTHNV